MTSDNQAAPARQRQAGRIDGMMNDSTDILRARAAALARKPDDTPATAALTLLEFRLGRERYALEAAYVREVCPLKDLTPLPGTPPFLAGIVNVRGRILPVIDLKHFFDIREQGLTDLHRIILVEGNGLELGLLADQVVSVGSIRADTVQPALPTLTGIRRDYLLGITEDRLIVLDISRLLADPAIIVDHDANV